MKITDYPVAAELSDSNVFLIDGGGAGTKQITAPKLAEYVKESEIGEEVYDVVAKHRNTFRGKNLGTSYTDEQKAAVQNGTFEDLYVGDYWNINGFTWRIADIDYFYNHAYTKSDNTIRNTDHHLVIFPDAGLFSTKMNETSKSTGYTGSDFYINKSNQVINILKSAFGDFLIKLPWIVDTSKQDTALIDPFFILPSNVFLRGYGINTNNPFNNDENIGFQFRTQSNSGQMALFRLNPKYICTQHSDNIPIAEKYWLSDHYTNRDISGFGYQSDFGISWWDYAYREGLVRPIFCIKG